MSNNSIDYLSDSLAAPLGNLISAIGEGVGEAQASLDKGSLEQTLALYEDSDDQDQLRDLLREIGYQPTFYAIPETKVKAKVSLSLSQSQTTTSDSGTTQLSKTRVYGTPMNASVVNQFGANIEASAEIEFSIKPVPPLIEARVAPNLEGKALEAAAELITKVGLVYSAIVVGSEETTEPSAADTVTAQVPVAGTAMKIGQEIQLTVVSSNTTEIDD